MMNLKTMISCATLGIATLGGTAAQAGDWSVDVRVVAGSPHGRVWVEPVYDVRCERVWVEPIYETRCERVWREPVMQDRCERVWIPDRYETREVRYIDYCGRLVIRYDNVLVERGHYVEQKTQVVIREGYFETAEQRICVREGGWQMIEKRVCVREGYWSWEPVRTSGGWDAHVERGSTRIERDRNDDADRFRAERERDRNQQNDREQYDRQRASASRDRGDRYR